MPDSFFYYTSEVCGGGNDGSCADLSISLFQSFFFFFRTRTKFCLCNAKESHTAWVKYQHNNPTVGPEAQSPVHCISDEKGVLSQRTMQGTPSCSGARPAVSSQSLRKALFSQSPTEESLAGLS